MWRGRANADTFPTHYKANTKGTIVKLGRHAGMELSDLRRIEGRPEYCRIHPGLYLCGLVYERIVNSSEKLAGWRVVIIGTLRKRDHQDAEGCQEGLPVLTPDGLASKLEVNSVSDVRGGAPQGLVEDS
jgi:hypothetical protein